jgi:tripartite-type tricarboxylate transporter receptor subunit TctC
MPDVPSVVEFGYRRLVLENFFGLTGPAKLPADMVAKLNTACNEVLGMPDIKRRLIELGITAVPTSTASFVTFEKDQVAVLGPAVKGAGVKL